MIKKGQWVEFTLKDGTHQGCVIKGGAKLTIAFGHKGNSYRQLTGANSAFKLVPTPSLDASGIMSAYELKSYKEAGGDETTRFEAKLCKNGKQIAVVSNNGCGGCNDYYPTNKATWNDLEAFNEAVKEWAIHYGNTEPFEPESNWIDWVTTGKVTGQSAKVYWDDYNTYMAK